MREDSKVARVEDCGKGGRISILKNTYLLIFCDYNPARGWIRLFSVCVPTFTCHSLQSWLLGSIANGVLAVNVASEEDRGSDSGSGGGEFLTHGDVRLSRSVTVAVASAKY